MTRCKMTCDRVSISKHWDKEKGYLYEYKFSPVMHGSEENKAFFAATPSGGLEFGCVSVKDAFIPGREYYVDIHAVEELPKAIE